MAIVTASGNKTLNQQLSTPNTTNHGGQMARKNLIAQSLQDLNKGHIHQIMQKVEGKVSFHTAMSTAFPQPAPGSAPSAGPMKVPADQLQQVLGITDVNYLVSGHSLAVVDSPLANSAAAT
jgi:hypothetical protein